MLSTSVNIAAIVLSVATLWALGTGLPQAGSLGSPAVEAVGAVGLHLQLAALGLVALVTSSEWRRNQGKFQDGGWPTLRTMAWAAPLAAIAQIGLGASCRYKLTGAIPHVMWAFAASILLLMYGAFVLAQAGAGRTMKRVAGALITVVGLQVVLGVAALLARVTQIHQAAWTVWAVGAHVVSGAVLLGLAVMLSAFILRCAEPAAETGHLATDGTNS